MQIRHVFAAFAIIALNIPAYAPQAQTALENKHIGALAPANLSKPRPKAPFNLTGTWNMVIDQRNGEYLFEPHPRLTAAAQAELDKYAAYKKKGYEYRDDVGACWPVGMPSIMTRYWPIEIIQLPTEIVLISMFDNNVRWIYMDGRSHPSPDDMVYTYNGHSVGHWEGDTLVIDTVGLTDDHHWLQTGIPSSTQLHIVERIRMVNAGRSFEDQFTMTDPVNWVGPWVNTKRYDREDRTDIEEHICIYEQMNKLPSFKYNIRK